MGVLIALLVLVSGLLICLKDPVIYYRLHRYEGQLLYMQAARYGFYCFLIASVFLGTFTLLFSHEWQGLCFCFERDFCIPPFSTDFLAFLTSEVEKLKFFKTDNAHRSALLTFFSIVSLLMLVIPTFWAKISLCLVRRRSGAENDDQAQAFILREVVSHSPLGAMLFEAFALRHEVMISMDDRKVYVGYIKSIGQPNEIVGVDEEIELLPSVSGYRDKDTLKVVYTTEYSDDVDMLPMFFKQENIVSISLFSGEIRAAFEEKEIKPKVRLKFRKSLRR